MSFSSILKRALLAVLLIVAGYLLVFLGPELSTTTKNASIKSPREQVLLGRIADLEKQQQALDTTSSVSRKVQEQDLKGLQAANSAANQAGITMTRELSTKPIRVLLYGANHTKKFWSKGFMDGLRTCEWFADPDIPDNIDSFLVMAGTPTMGGILSHELSVLYKKLYGKKAHHKGNYYTEAYHYGNPGFKIVEGCKYWPRVIDLLKNGVLNLSATFDRPKGAASFIANCAKDRAGFLKNVSRYYKTDHRGVCLRNVKVPPNSGRGSTTLLPDTFALRCPQLTQIVGDINFTGTKELHARQYRFLWALENKQFTYYVSEKIYGGLSAGSIPIYYGATKEQVAEFMPPNSFIYVPKYGDGKWLADLMHELESNRTLFNSYMSWGVEDLEALLKKHHCEREWPCKVCAYLNTVNTAYPDPLPLKKSLLL